MIDNLSFTQFASKMHSGLEMTPFHESYYRVLEAFARGKIRRLIVTVPPQHGKSLGSTILLPAYILGLNPDLRIAIASYSASLANRFNRRIQRIIDTPTYASIFPETLIKGSVSGNKNDAIRTADHFEVISRTGEVMSVGRDGALTGNQVDIFIIDDLYKNAMEGNSPIIREDCWEWYTSVVRTRQHNSSQELIVFTRWHEDDLIGSIVGLEKVTHFTDWSQLETNDRSSWLLLNFEALKTSPPTEIDPRTIGAPLWEERHSRELLLEKRHLDSHRFETMYQGNPSSADELLYGNRFRTYSTLPSDIVRYGNYTDTADTGDDYLCSICYVVSQSGELYITDVVYSREPMETTETLVAEMLAQNPQYDTLIESNNGGRGFARALQRMLPQAAISNFHQSDNKEARILSNASSVIRNILVPADWHVRWGDFASHLVSYRRTFRSNRWHDASDALTGVIEREITRPKKMKIRFGR